MNVTPLADLTEKEWQAQVIELSKQTGWKGAYHTFDSRRSSSGFPDLVLVRERVVYIELKSESGKLSKAQAQWIGWLQHADAEVYITRPSDLELLGIILASRAGRLSSTAAVLDERTRAEVARVSQ